MLKLRGLWVVLVGLMLSAVPARSQSVLCEDVFKLDDQVAAPALPLPELKLDPAIERLLEYSVVEARHRLTGPASYYSNSLDGTLTANGERYRMKKLSAAHLTLPLGCWVERSAKRR